MSAFLTLTPGSESQSLPHPASPKPFFPGCLLFSLRSFLVFLITLLLLLPFLFLFLFFLETNQNPKLQSIPYGRQHVPQPSSALYTDMGHLREGRASQEWAWEAWDLGLSGFLPVSVAASLPWRSADFVTSSV